MAAARIDARGASVDATEEVDAPDRLVAGHAPDQLDGRGRRLEVGKELRLLTPRLGRGVWHDALAEHVPAAGDLLVAGEGFVLVGVPALRLVVEVAALELTDVEERHLTGRARHEVVVVAAQPLQRLPVGQGALELGDLRLAVGDGGDLLVRDEVVAEDLPCEGEVGELGREADEHIHEVGHELVATLDEALGAIFGGVGLAERICHEALDLLGLRGRDPSGHRRSPSFSIRHRTVTAGLEHEAGASNSKMCRTKRLSHAKSNPYMSKNKTRIYHILAKISMFRPRNGAFCGRSRQSVAILKS